MPTLNKPDRPYLWTELKNSGTLELIKNDSLSKMISKYDVFENHLDDDFINERLRIDNELPFLANDAAEIIALIKETYVD